jgi:hypothetical protein
MERSSNEVLEGISEGKRLVGRPRRRWEYNIIRILKYRMGGAKWIRLAQERDQWPTVVNTVMNLRLS